MASETFTERRVRTVIEEQPPGALKLTLTYLLNEIARLKERIAELELRGRSPGAAPTAEPPATKPVVPAPRASAAAAPGMWMPPA